MFAGVDISAGFNGWSLKTLKGVVAEAGAHLERLNAELSEAGWLLFYNSLFLLAVLVFCGCVFKYIYSLWMCLRSYIKIA